jgi:histone H3/H4
VGIVSAVEKALRDIAEVARTRGLQAEGSGERLVVKHTTLPLEVVVERAGDEFKVELRAGKDLGEAIDEALSQGEDPREEVEEALDELVRIVDYAVQRLAREGIKARRETRQGIMDVYEALEERLEES